MIRKVLMDSFDGEKLYTTLMVVTTSVLFWRLSSISFSVSTKSRLKRIPRPSSQVPTWGRNVSLFLSARLPVAILGALLAR